MTGDRVLVDGKLGVVRYTGVTEFCDGWWYGIELEDCVGINDGSVQGKRYFDLQEKQGNYGIFAQSEDIRKIDDGRALREENRKLHSVVEALERKIRQWHMKWEQLNHEKTASDSQRTVKEWDSKYTALEEKLSTVQEENDVLKTEIKSLKEKFANLKVRDASTNQIEDDLNKELNDLRKENKQQESMLAIYAEIEEELRSQLNALERSFDEQKILESVDLIKSIEIRHAEDLASVKERELSLRSQIQGIVAQNEKSDLLQEIYEVVFGNEKPTAQVLGVQFEFLLRSVGNDKFNLPLRLKLKAQLYFATLCEIAKKSEEPGDFSERIRKQFGNCTVYFESFLTGSIGEDTFNITQIISFIRHYESLDSSCRLLTGLLPFIFGPILTQLLANLQKRSLPDDSIGLIRGIYSLSVSIKELCQQLEEKRKLGGELNVLYSTTISDVLEMVTSMIERYDEGQVENETDVNKVDLDSYKNSFAVLLNDLKHPQYNAAKKEEFPECNPRPNSNRVTNIKHQGMADDQLAKLHAKISEKDTVINELNVKNKLLEMKLTKANLPKVADHVSLESSDQLNSSNSESLAIEQPITKIPSRSYAEEADLSFDSITTEAHLKHVRKSDLLSEIKDLQSVIVNLTEHEETVAADFTLLTDDKTTLSPVFSNIEQPNLKQKTNEIAKNILDFAKCSTIPSYQHGGKMQSNYIHNAKFKQDVLDLKMRDLRT